MTWGIANPQRLSKVDIQIVNWVGRVAFNTKETLEDAGWTILGSGDGLAAFSSSGDVISNEGTGANGMHNDDAWFRMQSPDGQREFTYQVTAVSSAAPRARIKYSISAGFSGGAPSATQTPSATDEELVSGSGTDAAPVGENIYGGGLYEATAHAFLGLADKNAPFGFWFMIWQDASSASDLGLAPFAFDPIDGPPSADNDPYVWAVGFGGLRFPEDGGTMESHTQGPICFLDQGGGGEGFVRMPLCRPQPIEASNVNEHDASDTLTPLIYARRDVEADPDGVKGMSTLFMCVLTTTTGVDLRQLYTTEAGLRQLIRATNLALPWDGSLATNFANAKAFPFNGGGTAIDVPIAAPGAITVDIAGSVGLG